VLEDDDPGSRAFALFIHPTPGHLDSLCVPTPGNLPNFSKKIANTRGLAWGGGGGGGGRRVEQMLWVGLVDMGGV